MEDRPKLELALSRSDLLIELTGVVLLALLWILAFYSFINMPEKIPVHFNASGMADGFGNKSHIFHLPIIGTVIFAGITILNKYPHVFNYGVTVITPQNALRAYTTATRMLRYLKACVILIFLIIVYYSFKVAGGGNNLGIWLLPLVLSLIFIPVIFFFIRLSKPG